MKIILVSHGKLALGLKDTLEMIVGQVDGLYAFSAYSDGSEDQYLKAIDAILETDTTEPILIITDVLGGSVNNEVWQLLATHPQLIVLTGMNLPLLMTLVTYPNQVTLETIGEIVTAGQHGVMCINQLVTEKIDKEEF
ncbi:MAG: hypothetical protein LIR10_00190 [Bacillota bacterium]|nr:hypothetical protein [Bacillota bacterium]